MAVLVFVYFSFMIMYARAQRVGDTSLVHEWKTLDFEWPSEEKKLEAIKNKTYIPERNMVAGIKVYNDDVYVTIPRWFWTSGHPVTLAKVVTVQNQVKLRPYPSWAAQEQGNCKALQYVQGMEIDPNTGYIYIIDTGRIGGTLTLCRAKIVVINLKNDSVVQSYELPENIARDNNFINDIVLDYVGGRMRFAYITDANDSSLIVHDFQTGKSFNLKDKSMEVEKDKEAMIKINDIVYNFSVAIDGIAMSPDFKYVYYCALTGLTLYQVPTSSLRKGRIDGVRAVGKKISQSGGIGHGSKRLYYGAFGENAVYYWDSEKDMKDQKAKMDMVKLVTQEELVRNDKKMQWPDTFGFDNRGWIWFVSNRAQEFYHLGGLPKEGEPFMRIWKVYINETSYLYEADKRTLTTGNGGVSCLHFCFGSAIVLPVLISVMKIWIC